MARHSIPMDKYIEASRVFHWAAKRHYQLWFTGQETKRHRRSETVLHRLTKKGKLRSVLYGSKLIYTIPKKGRQDEFSGLSKIVHGLACTESLVRFFRSRMEGVVVAEKYFTGLGSVPEWGIIYPDGKMLLFEFSTKNNFFFTRKMQSKLQAYNKNLEMIEAKFNTKAIVVFVIDIPRETLKRWVGVQREVGSSAGVPASDEGDGFPSDPFYFVDYETFLKVPIGDQLKAPIYFWMDGKEYPLT